MTFTATLVLPYERAPLNLNDSGATMGAKFARAKKIRDLRNAVVTLARAQSLPRGLPHAAVALHYRPPNRRGRDEDNLVATAKPIYDALTEGRPAAVSKKSGRPVPARIGYGLVHDDVPAYMAKPTPQLHDPVKGEPGRLWVVIEWADVAKAAEVAA
jgi:crossover junction endodeoxyribonuclease RusA